jgi:site-specific DNA-methyltransferase (adenine-specific)
MVPLTEVPLELARDAFNLGERRVNALDYGDNLTVLRENVERESVDLIYLDPPFNSRQDYNVLFRSTSGEESQAQIQAFDDTWHWGAEAERAFDDVVSSWSTDAAEMIRSMRAVLRENDMMAYLSMMAVRLLELHRVLKPTGSIYLHCDPTASHYLKMLMDAVFRPQNFRNEIIWQRTSAHANVVQKFGAVHDVLLFYTKAEEFIWNQQYISYTPEYVEMFFDHADENGGTSAGIRRPRCPVLPVASFMNGKG